MTPSDTGAMLPTIQAATPVQAAYQRRARKATLYPGL